MSDTGRLVYHYKVNTATHDPDDRAVGLQPVAATPRDLGRGLVLLVSSTLEPAVLLPLQGRPGVQITLDPCATATQPNATQPEPAHGSVKACLHDARQMIEPQDLPSAWAPWPLLLLIDHDQKLPPDLLRHLAHAELITLGDLSSDMLGVRIQMAVQRRQQMPIDPIQRHAYDILRQVMRQSGDWMVLKDLQHRFRFVSRAFTEAFDIAEDTVIGLNDLEIGTDARLVYGDESIGWKGFWAMDDEVTDSGEPWIKQSKFIRQSEDGEVYERTDKIPLKTEDGEVYALLVRVSEVLRTQDDPEKRPIPKVRKGVTRDSLESVPMLKRLHDEKVSAEQRGQSSELAFLAKNRFIAAAGHDLRQPLHALGLFLGSLESRIQGEQETWLIQRMKRSMDAITDLLNSLLDISRLDANVVEAQRSHFALKPLLQSLYDEHHPMASQRKLDLQISCPDHVVFTDQILLARIIRNLLGNAIAHTKNGKVSVECEAGGNTLHLRVCDTGPGIPKDQQAAVFDEFHQLENPDRDRNKGLGLGLAIVQRLCRLLELDLQLRSVVGEGTRFTVTIPLGQLDELAQAHERRSTPEIQQHLVVVIDDDEAIRLAVGAVIEDHGCDTLLAESADGAIEQLLQLRRQPAALLVDYRLRNGETGDRAVERVRKALAAKVPAIIITGDTSAESLFRLREGGFQVLNKPVEPRHLLHAIGELLDAGSNPVPGAVSGPASGPASGLEPTTP